MVEPRRSGLSEQRRETGGGLFGRQKGKKLRDEPQRLMQTLLPSLEVPLPADAGTLDPAGLFPHQPDALVLEIGFGGGEHLLHRSRTEPGNGFIGVEPFLNGVAKAVSAIGHESIPNIRLYQGDAIDMLTALSPASLARIDILYPDPWPKRRQRKRRFVSPPALRQMARVLKQGGLLRFASDIDDYLGWTLALVEKSGEFSWQAESAADWRTPYAGWPGTRYEAKALREGRVPSYLSFLRR